MRVTVTSRHSLGWCGIGCRPGYRETSYPFEMKYYNITELTPMHGIFSGGTSVQVKGPSVEYQPGRVPNPAKHDCLR